MIDIANAMTVKNKTREAAPRLDREMAEAVRTIPYVRGDSGESASTTCRPVRARGRSAGHVGLADRAQGPALHGERRGLLGGRPGRRTQVPTTRPSARRQAAGTADPQPRRLPPRAAGNGAGRSRGAPPQRVEQTSNVASRGSADDPGVTSLVGAPGTPVLTVPSPNRVAFTAMTNMVANHVEWSVDGAVQGQAAPHGGAGRNGASTGT
ncbi:MAG: hypothetical protein WKF31_00395 [Thermoleophilaceae bacterium]